MDVQDLIQLNIEIEGLLRVVASRESEDAKLLLASKYNEFKTRFEQLFAVLDIESGAAPDPDTTVESVPDAAIESVSDAVIEPTHEVFEEVVPEIDVTAQIDEDLQSETHNEVLAENEATISPIVVPTLEQTKVEDVVAKRQNEMRVDEMLTRREARDLRKAFTLNDKFRFRRELFSNNDAQFAETLNILSAMKNMEEATEYMCDDLGWDMESEEVKDFVNIISNHY